MIDFICKSKSTLIFSDQTTDIDGLLIGNSKLVDSLDREVVFVLLPDHEIALQLYIILMVTESVPLFIPETISNIALARMVDAFHPSKIIVPPSRKGLPSDFSEVLTTSSYVMLQSSKKRNQRLDSKLCLLAATSGSTGSPKLVPQTHENIRINTHQICDALKLTCEDVALATLPLSYTFGMSVVNCQLMTSGTVVASDFNFLSKKTLKSILANNISLLAGVPTHFDQMLSARFFESRYARGIRKYLQAGGAINTTTYKLLIEKQKKLGFTFHRMYGQAEASTRISIPMADDFFNFPGSVGKPLSGLELRINPLEEGVVGAEAIGEIYCTGPNVCPADVYNYNDLINLANRPNDTLKTGDIGRIDDVGNLYIHGRLKRFCKLRGISFNLEDIEDELHKECKLFMPVVEFKDTLHLFCPLTKEDRLHSKIKLAFENINIKDYLLFFDVETPRLANGKVDYGALLKKISA